MLESIKVWINKAYPRNDAPLLRGHRPRSLVLPLVLTFSARQRTYEAAYWRTALGQFSFAAIVLSIFQSVFYPIGGKSTEIRD
jgi:hypothetical protein